MSAKKITTWLYNMLNEINAKLLNYIHQNPVRAGIVNNVEDYIYSSASNYAGNGGILNVEFS